MDGNTRARYCGFDDSIAYDASFLDQEVSRHGQFAAVAILAHEWGHAHQARAGLFNPGRTTFQNEQHADCQAGVFAAVARMAGVLDESDPMAAFGSLCAASDPAYHPAGHGTCEQRINAFRHGFEMGLARMDRLCSEGTLSQALDICVN